MNAHGATILQRLPGGGFVQRIAPLLPAHAMKTFEVRRPLASHYRRARCEEVGCMKYAAGWVMGFDLTQQAKVNAANTIRRIVHARGLRCRVDRVGTSVTFTFPPGQQCLEGHQVPLERDPLFIVRGGDWRGNPRRDQYKHTTGDSFMDDWRSSQERLDQAMGSG